MATINGKKPLSQKNVAKPDALNKFFRNRLELDDELKAELSSKRLEWRFINVKKYTDNGNYHEWGWQVYKREKLDSTASFLLGHSPDGIIRRGDSVLAVRPVEVCDAHRRRLREKAALQSSAEFKRQKAQELKAQARESGLASVVIHEGYEHDDEADETGD